MRSVDQIKRMIIQLEQMAQRLDSTRDEQEIKEIRGKIEMLEWVLDAPAGKYHA
ncbi:hypothetical protein ACFQ88_03205 [Paenibacillus sp. NPDC056579]|uniref:hypothetical protein n=1 Tax=unclassified Paenibacillus TaxID=185978 RepID=UPI001EF93DE7|nr:hypothetical protein [Paenibacillus sp. H1-7]